MQALCPEQEGESPVAVVWRGKQGSFAEEQARGCFGGGTGNDRRHSSRGDGSRPERARIVIWESVNER
jgi:hypothetical protein